MAARLRRPSQRENGEERIRPLPAAVVATPYNPNGLVHAELT